MVRKQKKAEFSSIEYLDKVQSDPIWFINNILHTKPWAVQQKIIEAVRDYPRVTVRSCNGIGKSYIAAQVILWFLYSFEYSIVLNTAPTWRQVEKLIWKEIRISHSRANEEGNALTLSGKLAPKTPELQIEQDRWYAAGISTNQPDRFQGWHAKNILVVVDEAAGVKEEIFEAVDGILTSENAKLLLLGNPTSIDGTFYKSHHLPGWKTFHVDAFMTPNFTKYKITKDDIYTGRWQDKMNGPSPMPWLIQPKWVADMYSQWGSDHPAWQARVEGEFPSQGEKTLIPLNWIEQAIERGKI